MSQKEFISEIDQFIRDFDRQPEAHSLNREIEEQKHKSIHQLRDTPNLENQSHGWWK